MTGHVVNEGRALGQDYFDNLTWEELFNNFCPAIVAYNDSLAADKKILKTDQAYHSVFAYDSDDNLFITLAEQYGYAYTSINQTTGKGSADFNNDNMKALLKTFHDAANNGYIISKGSAANNYTNTYFTKQNTLFSVGSTGGVKYQFDATNAMDVGVARIPHEKTFSSYAYGFRIARLSGLRWPDFFFTGRFIGPDDFDSGFVDGDGLYRRHDQQQGRS